MLPPPPRQGQLFHRAEAERHSLSPIHPILSRLRGCQLLLFHPVGHVEAFQEGALSHLVEKSVIAFLDKGAKHLLRLLPLSIWPNSHPVVMA